MLQHINAVVGMGSANQEYLPEAFEGVNQRKYCGKEKTVPHMRKRNITMLLQLICAIDRCHLV